MFVRKLNDRRNPGVGNDFFPGGCPGGGFGPRAQGVDFGTQKLTNIDQNSNFSLFIRPIISQILGLKHTKLA